MPTELRNFLALSYDELEEMNLRAKADRLKRVDPGKIQEERQPIVERLGLVLDHAVRTACQRGGSDPFDSPDRQGIPISLCGPDYAVR